MRGKPTHERGLDAVYPEGYYLVVMGKCKGRTVVGSRCRAWAMSGAEHCFAHNPVSATQKRAASAKGGENRRTPRLAPQPAKKLTVRSVGDLLTLMYRTVEGLHNGKIEIDVARSLAYVAATAGKLAETADLERRVETLETYVESLPDSECPSQLR